MRWMHEVQRTQQRNRHMREMKEVEKDLEKMVDWDMIQNLYPQNSEELKKYLGEGIRKSLNDPKRFLKPTPLDLLPASHRTVFVQKDQFERLKRDREMAKAQRKAAGEMDVDEPEVSTLSIAELEYLLEDLMGEEVRKRKEEELEMWMIQEDEKQTIYKTLNKEQRRSSLQNPEAQISKARSDTESSAKRPALPTLRTNSLVNQLETVNIRTAAPTPASPRETPRSAEERKRSNPSPLLGFTESKKRQVEDRRFGTSDVPENRLHHVYDRRSPRRDMEPHKPETIRRLSKEVQQEAVMTLTLRRESGDLEPTDRPFNPERRPSKGVSWEDYDQRSPERMAVELPPNVEISPLKEMATFSPHHSRLSFKFKSKERRSPREPPRSYQRRHSTVSPEPASEDRRASTGQISPTSHSSLQHSSRVEIPQSRRKSEQGLRTEYGHETSRSRSPSRRRYRDEYPRRGSTRDDRPLRQPWNVWVNSNSNTSNSVNSGESSPTSHIDSEKSRRYSEASPHEDYSDVASERRGREMSADEDYEYERGRGRGFNRGARWTGNRGRGRGRFRSRGRGSPRGFGRGDSSPGSGEYEPRVLPPSGPAAYRAYDERGRGRGPRERGPRREYESYKPSY
ncbi:hypothetical protein TWF694_010553 [Orbilia ellipsospora]|uniref:Uncharacterized protein n=1 Tax=Orbilia ellipsospora TaxID=2528407 RepID=A0AAV9XA79_9PEZI